MYVQCGKFKEKAECLRSWRFCEFVDLKNCLILAVSLSLHNLNTVKPRP